MILTHTSLAMLASNLILLPQPQWLSVHFQEGVELLLKNHSFLELLKFPSWEGRPQLALGPHGNISAGSSVAWRSLLDSWTGLNSSSSVILAYINFLTCRAYFYLLELLCNEPTHYSQQRPVFKNLEDLSLLAHEIFMGFSTGWCLQSTVWLTVAIH